MNEVPDVVKANSRSDKRNESWGERPHFHFGLVSPIAHQNSFILRNRWLISCEVESMSLQCSPLVKNDGLVYFGLWHPGQVIVPSYLDVWMKKKYFLLWLHDMKGWPFCGGREEVVGRGERVEMVIPSLWNSVLPCVCALPSVIWAHLVQI